MIARVVKSDESVIYKGKIYTHGETFEIDDSIGKSLIERGLIAGEEDETDDIDKMSYPKLKSYASELGLSANGRKDELIDRIKSHLASLPENEDDAEDEDAEGDETDGSPNTSMPE